MKWGKTYEESEEDVRRKGGRRTEKWEKTFDEMGKNVQRKGGKCPDKNGPAQWEIGMG